MFPVVRRKAPYNSHLHYVIHPTQDMEKIEGTMRLHGHSGAVRTVNEIALNNTELICSEERNPLNVTEWYVP